MIKPVRGSALSGTTDGVETVDARMLVLLRCVLGFSALAVVFIDPSKFGQMVGVTYLALGLYCVYSALLALISYRRWNRRHPPEPCIGPMSFSIPS